MLDELTSHEDSVIRTLAAKSPGHASIRVSGQRQTVQNHAIRSLMNLLCVGKN